MGSQRILVTGGAGFIGSSVIHFLLDNTRAKIINLDKLTYAGSLQNVVGVNTHPCYHFEQIDICDLAELNRAFAQHQPTHVLHLAAESHVDNSISEPEAFMHTNVLGTFYLLEATRTYWQTLPTDEKEKFRFLHVSTDEVYGDLNTDAAGLFSEESTYAPSNPYSASKASADHLVRAWHRTYGLPIIITNSANNYGPRQFPEKLIPLMIRNALQSKPLPVYGDGQQVRDWLYVEDHAAALYQVLIKGRVGETYNISAHCEKTNIEVVQLICRLLDQLKPKEASYGELIAYVKDRPGHDRRYALDATKISQELGWKPCVSFEKGLEKTVTWYVDKLCC